MKISIVICTYNRAQYIGHTLDCLAANAIDGIGEVLLIDNNSTDATADICHRFAEAHPSFPFRYVVETAQGLSHARNRGLAEAAGEWVVFLDDDAFVTADYVARLSGHIGRQPAMDAFGGRIDPLYESGAEPAWMSPWAYSWVSAINLGDAVRPMQGKTLPIGANMGVRRDLALAVGGFNTQLGRSGKNTMAGEEKDFFNRIRERGGRILYLPDVRVQHCIPPSRTTLDFIARLGDGVGASERYRTKNIGQCAYLKRLAGEAVKWVATLLLWARYAIVGQRIKGTALVKFRWHVTKALAPPPTPPQGRGVE